MKAVVIGLSIWILVGVAIPDYGAWLGFVLGAAATLFAGRLDRLERRLRELEAAREALRPAVPGLEPAGPLVVASPPAGPAPLAAAPMPAAAAAPVAPETPHPLAAAPAKPVLQPTPAVVKAPAREPVDAGAQWDWRANRPARAQKQRLRSWQMPDLGSLEELLAGRLLAAVGGVALLLGGIFFLGLAFSRGWIGPELRVLLGIVVGAGLLGIGSWLLLRPRKAASDAGASARRVVGYVLVGVGLAVISLALFAATRLYALVAPELGVAGSLLASGVAAAVAIRARSQLVAGLGLVAVLAAPPVMGGSPTLLTVAFVGVALSGTTAIALFRYWRWLPPVAFLLTAPQLAVYLPTEPSLAVALPALAIFWALNVLSAGGEEYLTPSDRLRETSATLLGANAAFAVWSGFQLLTGPMEPWRGVFLLALAAGHLGAGAFFLVRNGERHPFGMLVTGTGIAALTLAVPVQLGAPIVPMAWAAEAVALAWIYAERRHLYSGLASIVLGGLAIGHLLTVDYVLTWSPTSEVPFFDPSGAAAAFVLAAGAVAIWFLRRRVERIGVAAVLVATLAVILPQEVRGLPLIAALVVLAAACFLVERRWLGIALTMDIRGPVLERWLAAGERALYGAGAIAGGFGLILALDRHMPPTSFASGLVDQAFAANLPFLNEPTLAAAILVAASLVVGYGAGRVEWRLASVIAAAGVAAYLLPFELGPGWTVLGGSALAIVLARLDVSWRVARVPVTWAFLAAPAVLALELVIGYLPPDGFANGLRAWAPFAATPFWNEESAVAATVAVSALAIGFGAGIRPWRWLGCVVAAIALAYLVPFQEGPAWSVLSWAALGVALHVVAGRLRVAEPRPVTFAFALGAVLETLLVVAAPDRLTVRPTPFPEPALFNGGTLAAAALVLAFAARRFLPPRDRDARIAGLLAGAFAVWLLSIGTVDVFQARLGGATALEELQKQAQVAVSVLWAVLGVASFVVGLARRAAYARVGGLGLLGIVTLKVFVVDLAALDVAYRVLSFVALGVVLLGAAYLYSRVRPREVDRPKEEPAET